MHELALAQEIVDVVGERSGGAPVTRVVLEVGKLAAVSADALRFCFDLAAEDTVARGARLEIVETPGLARCRACRARRARERYHADPQERAAQIVRVQRNRLKRRRAVA